MKISFISPIFLAAALCCSSAFAQLPSEWVTVHSDTANASELASTDVARKNLQKSLKSSVFRLFVNQEAVHQFAESGVLFDGAAVAVMPSVVKDIVDTSDISEAPVVQDGGNPSSFFGRGLDRASSPFQNAPVNTVTNVSQKQFYLTTADWLNRAENLSIEIDGKRIPAKLEYRDDAQNVAVLSTPGMSGITGVQLFDAEQPMPALVFVLLSPNSIYESLTQHTLSVSEMHRYGTANLQARNGYPLFTANGELAGLSVSPAPGWTNMYVVHAGLLDRALHPKKYDRTKVEDVKLIEY